MNFGNSEDLVELHEKLAERNLVWEADTHECSRGHNTMNTTQWTQHNEPDKCWFVTTSSLTVAPPAVGNYPVFLMSSCFTFSLLPAFNFCN